MDMEELGFYLYMEKQEQEENAGAEPISNIDRRPHTQNPLLK